MKTVQYNLFLCPIFFSSSSPIDDCYIVVAVGRRYCISSVFLSDAVHLIIICLQIYEFIGMLIYLLVARCHIHTKSIIFIHMARPLCKQTGSLLLLCWADRVWEREGLYVDDDCIWNMHLHWLNEHWYFFQLLFDIFIYFYVYWRTHMLFSALSAARIVFDLKCRFASIRTWKIYL